MSWLSNHATELTAIGSIFMDLATLVIIFFNLNQLKLNGRSLNVDINFKVFDLRKNIYQDITNLVKSLEQKKSFRQYLVESQREGYEASPDFLHMQEAVANSKHLFALDFASELELVLANAAHGVSLEQRIIELQQKDPSAWSDADQKTLQVLGEQRNELIASILNFKPDRFLPYLNVSNFHKNLMQPEMSFKQVLTNAISKSKAHDIKGIAVKTEPAKIAF